MTCIMSSVELGENKNTFTFLWKVKNFIASPLKNLRHFKSPTFTSDNSGNSEWNLALYPHFKEDIWLLLSCNEPIPLTNIQTEVFFIKNDGSLLTENLRYEEAIRNVHKRLLIKRSLILGKADIFLPNDTLTVGCRIKNISDKIFNSGKCIAFTEISAEKFSVKFPLCFPFSTKRVQQQITVPMISVTKKYPDFQLVLKSDTYLHSVESLTIQIEMAGSSFPVFAVCKLSLQGADGSPIYLVEDEHWFSSKKDDSIWMPINSIPEQENIFQNKNSICSLQCTLNISDGTDKPEIETLIPLPLSVTLDQERVPGCPKKHSLKEKLRCLYADKRLCDFKIQVDGKEFPVHKTVLGSVSPVLCVMLEQNMKEKENSLLIIEDIDADTLERLIDFAYNETVHDLKWDCAVKLYSAADKYQILELKQICAEYINSNLSIENVTDALVIADMHQDLYLKKSAEEFIYTNSKMVFNSDKWNFFMDNNMKLANYIMHRTCIKLSESQVYDFKIL